MNNEVDSLVKDNLDANNQGEPEPVELPSLVKDNLDANNPIVFFLTEDDERVSVLIDDYYCKKDKEVLVYDPATKFSCDKEEQHGNTFSEIVAYWLDNNYLKNKQIVLSNTFPICRTIEVRQTV